MIARIAQVSRHDRCEVENKGKGVFSLKQIVRKSFALYCRLLRRATILFALAALLVSPASGAQQRTATFSITTNSATSAGAYLPDGRLVRTLWNNQPRTAGTHTVTWDGLDDSGVEVANAGVQAKVIAHNVRYVWEGVIGNTSSEVTGPYKHRSSFFINDMRFVGTNGIFCTGYNELQTMLFTIHATNYQTRRPLIEFEDYRRNFSICDTDGSLAYFVNSGSLQPEFAVNFVIAANLSNNISDRRWSFGANGADYDPWTSVIDAGSSAITGIAVQRNGNYLFVAHRDDNVVKVFHKKTGAFIKQFAVTTPSRLAINNADELWVVSTNTGTVRLYNNLTNSPAIAATVSGLSHPLAAGVSPVDGTLVVVDAGTNHQLKGFSGAGAPLWTYGQAGGQPANGANIATNKFWFAGSFLAFNTDGSFWVGDTGNSRAMLFDRFLAYKDSIQYMPHAYCSTVDLGNPTRVFANWLEFTIDYSKPINQSWTFVRNWYYAAPINIRTNTRGPTQVMTLSNGRTYTLMPGVDANGFNECAVVELLANGQMRECYRMQTDWYTFQPDGSLHLAWFASGGYVPIYRKRLLSFDANQNPIWSANELIASIPSSNNDDPWPRGFSGLIPPRYNISSSGLIMTYATPRGNRWHLGGTRTNSNTYVFKTMPEEAWQVDGNGWVINPRGTFDPNPAVSYAGNQSMTVGRNTILGYHGEFWGGGQANQWLHFYDNGLFVGQFGRPVFPNANGDFASPETAGNAFSPTLINHNGNLYLYHNDESCHAGVHRWRVDGWNQIAEITASFSGGPSVSLTSPTAGATFVPGTNLVLAASASVATGAVQRVEFYSGATLLGQDTTSPYSFNWNSIAAGSYSLTARVFDTGGASAASAVVAITVVVPNAAPTATLTAPANGASVNGPTNLTLTANATDADGSITKVEFFNGATKLGEDTTAPYSFIWTGVPGGTYSLSARATDNAGAITTSAANSVTVVGPANQAPTVALTAPAGGSSFTAPANVTLTANASDADGSVSKVEFFHGATKLGEDTATPFAFTWTGVSAGSYAVTARATDNLGATANSAVVSFSVTNAPGSTNLVNGLKGQYFNNTTLTGTPALTRVDPTVLFAWGNSSPGAGVNADQFSVRWTGKVQPRYTQNYIFHGLADDHIRLWVNGQMVFDGWVNYSNTEIAGFIELQADQMYDIVVEMAEDFGGAGINLWWSCVTQPKEIIPTSRLWTVDPNASINQSPTVSLTAPTNGVSYTSPAAVTLTANAADADGTVARVEFYNGTTKLGEDMTAPYAYTWAGVTTGSYTLFARAVDNSGATNSSAAVTITVTGPPNQPPGVVLVDPANGATYAAPATIAMQAIAGDSDGAITKVEFFAGATKLGEDTTDPYNFTWAGATAGTHTLTARAIDNAGATGISGAIIITVTNPPASTNLVNGLKADYFNNTTLTGTPALTRIDPTVLFAWGNSSPGAGVNADQFSVRWTGKVQPRYTQNYIFHGLADDHIRLWVNGQMVFDGWVNYSNTEIAGFINLQADQMYDIVVEMAEDYGGAGINLWWSCVTQPKEIIPTSRLWTPGTNPPPNQPPTVALAAPANGTSVYGPANLFIAASASDPDGTMARVEFYNGTNYLGQAVTAPFSIMWNNAQPGAYSITAVAYDNNNAYTLATPAIVNVLRPGIAASVRLGNGAFQLTLNGAQGRTNSVHVSSDLNTWVLLTNVVNTTGQVTVTDAEAALVSRRYYRVWAESLFLSNVVGFAKVTAPPGYSIVANPFVPANNTVAAIFGAAIPNGTSLSKFRPTTGDFAINTYDADFVEWQAPAQPFGNGEAAFVNNPSTNPFTIVFQGDVPQGLLTRALTTGYSMVGSQLPQSGLLQTELQFPANAGDTVYIYRNGRYYISEYDPIFGGWSSEPSVNVGEGFFLLKSIAGTWTRSFSATGP